MISFWYFVPKSGIAFIFLSVITIVIWGRYRDYLSHPILVAIAIEVGLFIICFFVADKESERKIKK